MWNALREICCNNKSLQDTYLYSLVRTFKTLWKSELISNQALSVLPFVLTQHARVPEEDGKEPAIKTISSGARSVDPKSANVGFNTSGRPWRSNCYRVE
jgi:hypothetical protein